MEKHLYRPMLRPASSFTLPKGLKWEYDEAPATTPIIATRLGIPLSLHPHGVICTEREVTKEEMEHFSLQIVQPQAAQAKTIGLTDNRCPRCNRAVRGHAEMLDRKPSTPTQRCQHCGVALVLKVDYLLPDNTGMGKVFYYSDKSEG